MIKLIRFLHFWKVYIVLITQRYFVLEIFVVYVQKKREEKTKTTWILKIDSSAS